MDKLNTKRVGMKKINQLSTHDFLKFLKEILPCFNKNNELDLDKVTVSEKIDGTAIRLAIINNDLFFESSYSGLVSWDKMPFPEQTELMYKKLKSILVNISNTVGYEFKLIGELIWAKDLVENEKVTPVGASYLAKYFGSFGGLIIFDIKKIVENDLIDLSEYEFNILKELIKRTSDSEFNFYSSEDLIFNKTIKLTKNVKSILDIINQSEYNKPRFNKVKDFNILNTIENIREDILISFESVINSITGHFSEKTDLIEGIVINIKSSGNTYGLFSNNYKEMKNNYVKYENNIEQAFYTFLNAVFNNKSLPVIKRNYKMFDRNYCEQQFNKVWPIFYNEFVTNFNKLKYDTNIPKASKYAQTIILNKKLNTYNKIKNYQEFEQYFIF